MHRTFKFRVYPTAEQAETLGQWVGVTRLVYNLALEQRRDFWRQYRANEGRSISVPSQCRELTELRRAYDWIEAVPRHGLEAALHDLNKAYEAFFRGGGYPQPRRLGENDSIRFRGHETPVEALNSKWARVRVPKLGWVRLRMSRAIAGRPATTTLRRAGDGWFMTVTSDIGEAPAYNSLPAVGIDRGVINTFSLSNGEIYRLPNMTAVEKKRRRAQRVLARRKRGSRRYSAQRRVVSRLAAQIGRIRAHHLHVASADLSRRFGVVALEDLKIGNMTASAKGTLAEPGRRVAQKAGLNRSILAQGWGMFAAQLDYKLEAAGGRLISVPAAYTSQTCAGCGVVDARSRKSQAVFECGHCGHSAHADTNAAIEILRRSTAVVEKRHSGRSCEARTLAA